MKKLKLTLLVLSLIFVSLTAQTTLDQMPPMDTVTLQWETLPERPGDVQHYAKNDVHVYAGTRNGLYVSTDNGSNWEKAGLEGQIVSLLANDSIVMAVTYRSEYLYYYVSFTYQTYISRDKGETFELAPMSFSGTHSAGGGHISTPAFNGLYQKNDSTIYFMYGWNGDYGWYNYIADYTADYGTSWQPTEHLNASKVEFSENSIYTVNKDTLYIATEHDLSDTIKRILPANLNFYYNNSAHWTFLNGELLFFKNLGNNSFELYRSFDDGENWTSEAIPFGGIPHIFIGGEYYLKDTDLGLIRSDDANFYDYEVVYGGELRPKLSIDGFGVYEDNSIYVSPFGGGTLRLSDQDADWVNAHQGLGGGYIAYNKFFISENEFWMGNHDSGYWRTGDGTNYEFFNSPALYSDPGFDLIQTVNTFNGSIFVWSNNKAYRSADNGQSWTVVLESQDTRFFKNQGNRIFAFDRKIFYSDDNGDTWTETSIFLNTIREFEIDGNDWYVLATDGTFYRSEDEGATWEPMNPVNIGFSTFSIDTDHTIVAIQGNGGVWISQDFGQSWTNTGQQLPPGTGQYPDVFYNEFLSEGNIVLDHSYFSYAPGPGYHHHAFIASGNYGLDWYIVNGIPGDFGTTTYYEDDTYVYWTGSYDWFRLPKSDLNVLEQEAEYGLVEGHIYRDLNDNCIRDAGEPAIVEKVVKFVPGDYYAMTDINGFYSVALPPGVYDAVVSPLQYHETNCTGTVIPDVEVLLDQSTTMDISYAYIPDIHDLEVFINPLGAARPGFDAQYQVTVKNVGTEPIYGVSLLLDFPENFMSFNSSDPAGTDVGSAVFIDFGNMFVTETKSATYHFTINVNTPIGEELIFSAEATHGFEEETPANNIATLRQVVTGSFDPNDKLLNAPELDSLGRIGPGFHTFDYTIRFQNTGTDTAFSVVIKDIIEEDLDPLNFRTIDASHPFHCQMSLDGELTYIFDQIMLPDSNVNEPASHGFVRFELTTNGEIPDGRIIENDALIYFDFNAPVATNNVLALVEKPVITIHQEFSLCEGEEFQGEVYTMDTMLVETVEFMGYDSITITELSIYPLGRDSVFAMICEGETFTLGGQDFTETGVFEVIFQEATIQGCDSLVICELVVSDQPEMHLQVSICEGETYPFGEEDLFEEGYYELTLAAANGCDSLVMLDLEVSPQKENHLVEGICEGEAYTVGSSSYTETGDYTDTLQTTAGCDSIVYTHLTVLPTVYTLLEETVCFGESYTVGTSVYTETGVYEDALTGFNGCDSIVNLHLTVSEKLGENFAATICQGAAYDLNGTLYTEEGMYTEVLTASNGCDSTLQLDLTVLEVFETTIDTVLEFGALYEGVAYESDTTLMENFVAQNGCDSLVTIHISVDPLSVRYLDGIEAFYVYPNPAQNRFFVQIELSEPIELQVDVYNTLGRKISNLSSKQQLSTGKYTLELDAGLLSTGTYFLFLQTGEGSVSRRLVVAR